MDVQLKKSLIELMQLINKYNDNYRKGIVENEILIDKYCKKINMFTDLNFSTKKIKIY